MWAEAETRRAYAVTHAPGSETEARLRHERDGERVAAAKAREHAVGVQHVLRVNENVFFRSRVAKEIEDYAAITGRPLFDRDAFPVLHALQDDVWDRAMQRRERCGGAPVVSPCNPASVNSLIYAEYAGAGVPDSQPGVSWESFEIGSACGRPYPQPQPQPQPQPPRARERVQYDFDF